MANYVGEIAVRVRPLSPEDSLARAAEAIRMAPGGAAPVQEAGQIIGLVTSTHLADWIGDADPVIAKSGTVRQVLQSGWTPIRHDLSIREGLEQLRAGGGLAAAVIDPVGRYLGMVS